MMIKFAEMQLGKRLCRRRRDFKRTGRGFPRRLVGVCGSACRSRRYQKPSMQPASGFRRARYRN